MADSIALEGATVAKPRDRAAEEYVSAADIAGMLSVSQRTSWRLVAKWGLRRHKILGCTRFNRSEVLKKVREGKKRQRR